MWFAQSHMGCPWYSRDINSHVGSYLTGLTFHFNTLKDILHNFKGVLYKWLNFNKFQWKNGGKN